MYYIEIEEIETGILENVLLKVLERVINPNDRWIYYSKKSSNVVIAFRCNIDREFFISFLEIIDSKKIKYLETEWKGFQDWLKNEM